jgi:4-cresol dehydrogenase (hydroxylating)
MSTTAGDPATSLAFRQALTAWKDALGPDHVLETATEVDPYTRCTIPLERRILAVLRPGSVEEVQEVTRIATAFGQPIYPVSTGRNWGYGTACPVLDDHVVVDLGRMNRILEVNTDLAYAVIEPGVSQQQLADHLRMNRIPLWIDPTGASPTCSIVGNAIERGFGITPYSDHFLSTCGLEIVLPTGELLKTGFGHIPSAKTMHLFKWGVGPYLDGLFSQSNLGIVTKMGLWLMPVPECFAAFYFKVERDDHLGAILGAVRSLRHQNVVLSPVNFVSRVRVMTLLRRYPWEVMDARADRPMPDDLAENLGRSANIGAWNVSGALYGTKAQVTAAKRAIRRALPPQAKHLLFVSESRLRRINQFKRIAGWLTGYDMDVILELLHQSFGIMRGEPSEVSMPTPYWRNRTSRPKQDLNPSDDGCGLIWFSPVIPYTASDVEITNALAKSVFEAHGFDYCPTMTAVSGRCLDCTMPILYDRSNAVETGRAGRCYEELLNAFLAAGYPPYRVPVTMMDKVVSPEDTYWKTVGRLKEALDPSGVLAPGRYAPLGGARPTHVRD